jgi:hypothetical protein
MPPYSRARDWSKDSMLSAKDSMLERTLQGSKCITRVETLDRGRRLAQSMSE